MHTFEITEVSYAGGIEYLDGIATYSPGESAPQHVITKTRGEYDLWKFKKTLTQRQAKDLDKIIALLTEERSLEMGN